MIHRTLLMAAAMVATAAITACSDTTAPKPMVPGDLSLRPFPRSGAFRLEKDCQKYGGLAGDSCRITSSTLRLIKPGSKIIYLQAAPPTGLLDTDVILDPPGRGHDRAFGRCAVNLGTGLGVCDLTGGTGEFKGFHAHADVKPLGDLQFEWIATYSFSRRD